MAHRHRLRNLERLAAPPRRDGLCSCCSPDVVILRAGEPEPPPAVCDRCGLVRRRYRIREVLGPPRMVALGGGEGSAKLMDAEAWEAL